MKKTLGIIGTLICSLGLLALPAAAQERGNRANNWSQQNGYAAATSPTYRQGYAENAQTYSPRNSQYGQSYNRYSSYEFQGQRNGQRDHRDSRFVADRHDGWNVRRDNWNARRDNWNVRGDYWNYR